MHSHRDQDGFGFPSTLLNQTLHEAESTRLALTCQCLLENVAGSETSAPLDPHISVVSDGNRRPEVSQISMPVSLNIIFIPRSPIERSLEVLTEQPRRWDRRHTQPPAIVHVDSDESDELSTVHEHERTLIQLVKSRTTRFHHALGAFRRPFSAVSNFNTCSRVICSFSRSSCGRERRGVCTHISMDLFTITRQKKAVFTSPFLKRKPREAAFCRMSCLERRLNAGDSERISVISRSVKPITTRRAFPSSLWCPQPLATCEPDAST